MIVILTHPATAEDIEKASQEYKSYVKITIDIKNRRVAIGGEYHFDAEQELLKLGSSQEDIWGGGLELHAKNIETFAMINVRAKTNPSQDILNPRIKEQFCTIAHEYLSEFANHPPTFH